MPDSRQVIRPLPPAQILPQHRSNEARPSLLQRVCGWDECARRVIGAVAALPNSHPHACRQRRGSSQSSGCPGGRRRPPGKQRGSLGQERRRALGDGARPAAGMQGGGPKGVCQAGVPLWAAFPSFPGSGAPSGLSAALGTPGPWSSSRVASR